MRVTTILLTLLLAACAANNASGDGPSTAAGTTVPQGHGQKRALPLVNDDVPIAPPAPPPTASGLSTPEIVRRVLAP